MANLILHKAATRGVSHIGWLESYHTFSFSQYYDPTRIHFGALRVLNDDTVAPGMGFGKHPHQNMEIISIPLEGSLQHQDSMGNTTIIQSGEVQIMSAGTGVAHSEFNASKTAPVKFLQIWVFPQEHNLTPSYDQKIIDEETTHQQWATIVSPKGSGDAGLAIHQQAWFSMGMFKKQSQSNYTLHHNGNGLYVFVLQGSLEVEGQSLSLRDGLGITDAASISLNFNDDSKVLLMEVPMH